MEKRNGGRKTSKLDRQIDECRERKKERILKVVKVYKSYF